jgi:argonaute-like protein implicated in RNA metabolism and viral defense
LVQRDGKPEYLPREDKRGLLSGYLRMVALNKILLTNQRWPFVLETRLNADLTIGVDVKHHTVGLVSIGSNGADIRALPPKTSRQKEKLDTQQMKAYLVEIVRLEARTRTDPIVTLVLQRDGRVYDTEIKGTNEAIELLKAEHTIAADATITVLEIAKSSRTRFRLFDTSQKNDRIWVDNPQIGTYSIMNQNEGYLCATGRAFRRNGTVKPLYIRRIAGPLSLEECLEDVFYLTTLAWTRPNDCSRYPITTKLNDRFLGEEATDYDTNALDIASILDEEDIDE